MFIHCAEDICLPNHDRIDDGIIVHVLQHNGRTLSRFNDIGVGFELADARPDGAIAESIQVLYSGVTKNPIRGRTVFISSHALPEVARVCDRIAMLRKGEVVLLSSVQDARKLASRRVRVALQQDVAVPACLPQGYEMEEERLEDVLVKYYREGAE